MNVVISREDLVSLLSKVLCIVPTKPAIPILSNILIETADDQIIFSTTDLTTSMQGFLEAKVINGGDIAISARKFFQLVKELTSPQIKISCEKNIVTIISGSSCFKLNGMPKSEFPNILNLNGKPKFSMSSSKLKEMLSKTGFSAAKDDIRTELNGINLKIENQIATFFGTDGKKLAKTYTEIDILAPSGSYIIPIKAAEEMIKIMDSSNDLVSLSLMPKEISVESSNITITTKLLSGIYPSVDKVIPKTKDKIISLHREELISLLRQIVLFVPDDSSSIIFTFKKGELALSSNCKEVGEGNVTMPIDYGGEAVRIAFNPFFLLEILRRSGDETVNLSIKDSYSPGVVTDSSKSLFVLMPMKQEKDEVLDDSEETALT